MSKNIWMSWHIIDFYPTNSGHSLEYAARKLQTSMIDQYSYIPPPESEPHQSFVGLQSSSRRHSLRLNTKYDNEVAFSLLEIRLNNNPRVLYSIHAKRMIHANQHVFVLSVFPVFQFPLNLIDEQRLQRLFIIYQKHLDWRIFLCLRSFGLLLWNNIV